MKKWLCLMLALALLGPSVSKATGLSGQRRPAVILYTYYRQMGWGDRVQIGCVDEEGGLWLLIGNDGTLRWPYQTEDQLSFLRKSGDMQQMGELSYDEMFSLKSLISSAPDQGRKSHPAACDAGTEYSYAVQYDREGESRCVLLGMSGDDVFENTDPNAQALYRWLREKFPFVTCYGGAMGPAGFQPVPILKFCKIDQIDLSKVSVKACANDCEAGVRQLTLSEEEEQSVLLLLEKGMVTGKANATLTTGGTVSYGLYDAEGNFLCSVEFYRGLLVRSDGMYNITRP